jgi:hypothetical protein
MRFVQAVIESEYAKLAESVEYFSFFRYSPLQPEINLPDLNLLSIESKEGV